MVKMLMKRIITVSMIEIVTIKGIRDAGSTADFRILFEVLKFENLEIFENLENFGKFVKF